MTVIETQLRTLLDQTITSLRSFDPALAYHYEKKLDAIPRSPLRGERSAFDTLPDDFELGDH